MGKKYLDTKQNTIEAAVLDVWVDAAEEQEAIQSAARMVVNDTIREMEQDDPRQTGAAVGDPGRGGTSVAMQKQRKREKEQKELQRQAKVGQGKNAPGELTPAARRGERGSRRVDVVDMLPPASAGEGGRPTDSPSVKPKPKPDTRRSPGALGGRAPGRSPGALGGPAKPSAQPDTRRSPGALGGK